MKLIILFVFFVTGCTEGYTIVRERFIRLPPEERQKEREWCSTHIHQGCVMSLHHEPTPQELERLKNEKK